MKKIKLVLALFIAINMVGYTAVAQTATNEISLGMPEVLLLASNSAPVNLVLSPQSAGNAVSSSVSSSAARVLISSVVSGTQTRTMSAKVTTGEVPAGTLLKLEALAPNVNFVGTAGTLGAEVTLNSETDMQIISGIGTCYSGTSSDDGYGLKYTCGIPASPEDYALIRASGGVSVTVTLTLSAGV